TLTGGEAAVADGHSDSGCASLVESRGNGHSPVGARTAENNITNRNQSRVTGSARDGQASHRSLRIANSKGDRGGGCILAGGQIGDAGNGGRRIRRGVDGEHTTVTRGEAAVA